MTIDDINLLLSGNDNHKQVLQYTTTERENYMKHLISSLAVATVMLFSSTAFASVVTVGGSSSGIFTNPVEQSNSWYSGVGTQLFLYGKGSYWIGGTSGLLYKGDYFEVKDPSEKFKIGTLKYFNGTSYVGTSVDAVDLEVSIDFAGLTDQKLSLGLNLDQTLNSLSPADDYVYLPEAVSSSAIFNINGKDFLFMALFGKFIDGVFTEVDYLQVAEKHYGSVGLYGMFTPVPVPAAFWLFGSALATLFVTRRKAIATA
jgi:hypothetical protein